MPRIQEIQQQLSAILNQATLTADDFHQLSLLIAEGGESVVNITNQTGDTALILAAKHYNLEGLTTCVNTNNVWINYPDSQGKTAFFYAAAVVDNVKCLQQLLQHPEIAMHQKASNGFTPLQNACYLGNYECVDLILKNSAEIPKDDLIFFLEASNSLALNETEFGPHHKTSAILAKYAKEHYGYRNTWLEEFGTELSFIARGTSNLMSSVFDSITGRPKVKM